VTITLGRKDSYCIGISKSILRGVPVVWDDGNTQLREIWSSYQSAMPLYTNPGRKDLSVAAEAIVADGKKLRRAIDESWEKFLGCLSRRGYEETFLPSLE
jgi:hypothetical protein